MSNTIANLVAEGQLDALSLCEVGGYRQGFRDAGIKVADVTALEGASCSNVHNYLTAWNFHADASQLSLTQILEPQIHTLVHKSKPDLVVEVFGVHGMAKLVLGNLHLRTPTGMAPSTNQNKKTTSECFEALGQGSQ